MIVMLGGNYSKSTPHGKGLHYVDWIKVKENDIMMVTTVRGNYEGYTDRYVL